MKIQLGKKYKTRNGCTATVVLFDPNSDRQFAALVTGPNDPEHTRYYAGNGLEHHPLGSEPQEQNPYDIIEPIE